ncbi:hypothetical protein PAXRUDRAFT_36347 [Paxillus rubicundulus Ve08.2h10]|uniref:Uncharacterized protein n=1 Tax=Paxillus rubicundulus Ve08.2h10 TaxID=930991 RepID=A0A0D0D7Y9_9AGAM|nr:hypothetical protein PAXRUDRAFT_36347 [Paxillus rubicundulus Ve08.2h10]
MNDSEIDQLYSASEEELDNEPLSDSKPEDEPPCEISGHLFHKSMSTQVVSAHSHSGKGSTTVVKSDQCPAFLFSTTTSFNDLLQEIVKAAKMNWKLLANNVGYKTMLKSIEVKKGNPVIFFYLPKPVEIEEPPMLLTIWNDLPMTNCDKLASGENDSIKGQIRGQLEEKYPVGNYLLFPGKRIYAAKEKDCWELSPLHLDVWAAAIAEGQVTYDTPPMSAHFTASASIKPHWPEPGSSLGTFTAYHMYQKVMTGQVETMQAMAPIPGNELMYQPGIATPLTPASVPTGSNVLPAVHDPPSAMSSPGSTTSHGVTLETFCTQYVISTKNAE